LLALEPLAGNNGGPAPRFKRLFNLLDATFGPGKRHGLSGSEGIELAWVRLYRATGEARYLRLGSPIAASEASLCAPQGPNRPLQALLRVSYVLNVIFNLYTPVPELLVFNLYGSGRRAAFGNAGGSRNLEEQK
jgi:hypothetical protein